MMGSDEAMMGSDEVRGENNSSLLQALEKEVLALRQSESSLIAELQRRCDKMIELEVHLDEERARANRLQRERAEEDEALSGELRDIMATVALDSANSGPSLAAGADVPSSDSAEEAGTAKSTNGATATATVTAGEPVEQKVASDLGDSAAEPSGASEAAGEPAKQQEQPTTESSSTTGGGGGAASGASGFFAEWRARRAKGARTDINASFHGDGAADENGKKSCAKAEPTPAVPGEKEEVEGRGGGAELPPKDRGREQAAGALRARVVELELQRANAEDEMREKMDRSIRLEVQVEQLKNVVQSLSHASAQDEPQGWDGKSSKKAGGGKTPGTIDLDPLLRDVPGVDPHVLLLLHRSPWADGVIEGIRKEESCFEWQGRDSRGDWSSKLCNLPAELSSLPFHSTGLPPPPSPTPTKSQSPPSSGDGNASETRERVPSAANGDAEPGEHEVGAGGLKEKIGEAVAALGAAGRGLGGSRGAPVARTVTDEGMTLRFELDNVSLPSEHWEWVGGWMVDSEREASTDQDGWVYGRAAAEISEIALGRKPAGSRNIDDSYRGGDDSGSGGSNSSNSGLAAKQSASDGESAAGSLEAAGVPTSPSRMPEAGEETSPQQQQQQQQQQQEKTLLHPNLDSDPASPASPVEQQADADSEGLQQQEKDGAKAGAGPAAAGSGGGDGGAGEEGAADAEGGPDRGEGGEGLWLRRRRLVRLRMVRKVDGARESTTSVLEMMRRLCSLEVLVRKLSSQVVAQQRQVTSLESQVAFLAPLHPKLKMACALGRKDRQRGNALQGRLIEAENEIKVLRRCLSAANAPRSAQQPRPRLRPVPITSAANTNNGNNNASGPGRQPPKSTGRLSAQELEEADEMSESHQGV